MTDDLAGLWGDLEPKVVLFFASTQFDFARLAEAVAERFPDATSVGCTTAGELGELGLTRGSVSLIAFGGDASASARLIEDFATIRSEKAMGRLRELLEEHGRRHGRPPGEHSSREFVLTLTDGLSGAEERLLTAVTARLPDAALVGASAGDDFNFEQTWTAVNGVARAGASAIAIVDPGVPSHPFHLSHYTRGDSPHVVTGANPWRRELTRIDGYNAVDWLCEHLHVPRGALLESGPQLLAATPVVFGFRAGRQNFMRMVMEVREDALLLGGSIEEGAVIHRMIPGDLIRSTSQGMAQAREAVEGAQASLLFNCAGRFWEAHATARVAELAGAMCQLPTAGFTTYGEQIDGMHLNQTLAGVVFGGAR